MALECKPFVSKKINDSVVKDIVFGTGDGGEGLGKIVRGSERPTKMELERDTQKLLGMMQGSQMQGGGKSSKRNMAYTLLAASRSRLAGMPH